MTWIVVSLDAATPEAYRRLKRADAFERAVAGVRALAAAPGPATVGLSFLLTGDNWADAPAMATLAEGLGVDYCQFRPAVRTAPGAPGVVGEDPSWIDAAFETLGRLGERPGVEIDLERFGEYRHWAGHGYTRCWWCGLQCVVTPDGSVFSCVNRREVADSYLGNVAEGFAGLWARRTIREVDAGCRVLCRGHLPNLALGEMLRERAHGAFV